MPAPLTERDRIIEALNALTPAERALPTSVIALIIREKLTRPDASERLIRMIENPFYEGN